MAVAGRKNNKGQYGPDQIELSEFKFEACYLVSVSTLHVLEKDCDILQNPPQDHPQYILNKPDSGFLVSVWHECFGDDVGPKLKELGHSEAYINLVGLLGRIGAKYLDLDCDGQDYDFLPRYEW